MLSHYLYNYYFSLTLPILYILGGLLDAYWTFSFSLPCLLTCLSFCLLFCIAFVIISSLIFSLSLMYYLTYPLSIFISMAFHFYIIKCSFILNASFDLFSFFSMFKFSQVLKIWIMYAVSSPYDSSYSLWFWILSLSSVIPWTLNYEIISNKRFIFVSTRCPRWCNNVIFYTNTSTWEVFYCVFKFRLWHWKVS